MACTSGVATRHCFGTTLCEIRTEDDGERTTVSIFIVQEGSLALQVYGCGEPLVAETHQAARRLAICKLEATLGPQTTKAAEVEETAEYQILGNPRSA